MMTIRQIQKSYTTADYARLLHDLTSHRADAVIRWDSRANQGTLAAAMGAARLDELSQPHHPFCVSLLKAVLSAQEADGGWGDPLTSALCLRALLANRGNGLAIDRGLNYLAALQQDDGALPSGPFRRMPADVHITAGVLYLLAEYAYVWQRVNLSAVADWLDTQSDGMDPATRVLWRHASLRCRQRRTVHTPSPAKLTQVA